MEERKLYVIKKNKSNESFPYIRETTLKNGLITPVSPTGDLKTATRFTKEEAMKIIIDNPIDSYIIIEETKTYKEVIFEFNVKEKRITKE